MENTKNRNDAINFFRDMPQEMQIEIIEKMKRDAKKPPDQLINKRLRRADSARKYR